MTNNVRGSLKMEREWLRREEKRRKQLADNLKAKYGIKENQTDTRRTRS
jgi:hypothetical protein